MMESYVLLISHILFFTSIILKKYDFFTICCIYILSIFVSTFLSIYSLSELIRPFRTEDINSIIHTIPKDILVYCIIFTIILN